MKKTVKILLWIILGIIIVIWIIGVIKFNFIDKKSSEQSNNPTPQASGSPAAFDPRNASYFVDGESVSLVNGKFEKKAGSDSKIEAALWGEYVLGDLNGDKANDAAAILVYSGGGSGTFYYVAFAIKNTQTGKASGGNALLLGDRIAPQNIFIDKGIIVVNYADRKKDEPMVAKPSVGITRQFSVDNGVLKEVTSSEAKKEQACLMSGGTIGSALCCQSVAEFPNSCAIGACGCAPANSHQIKSCNCEQGKCFNGAECVSITRP